MHGSSEFPRESPKAGDPRPPVLAAPRPVAPEERGRSVAAPRVQIERNGNARPAPRERGASRISQLEGIPEWMKRKPRDPGVVHCGKSTEHLRVGKSVRRVDVDPIDQLVALELHPAGKRQLNLRPFRRRPSACATTSASPTTSACNRSWAPEGIAKGVPSGERATCWVRCPSHSGNGKDGACSDMRRESVEGL